MKEPEELVSKLKRFKRNLQHEQNFGKSENTLTSDLPSTVPMITVVVGTVVPRVYVCVRSRVI